MEIQQFSLLGSSNLLESSLDAVTPLLGSHVTMMLQGRINALAAVPAYTKGEAISKELVKAIVGIEPEEDV